MAKAAARRLYLISPFVDAQGLEAFAATLTAVLPDGGVASLLLRIAPEAQSDAKKIVQRLLPLAVSAEVALLLENDARLAARVGADGVHSAKGPGELAQALSSLKPERIVGAGLLRGRDEAMGAGEAGADYVMFGEPRPDGFVPPAAETLERIAWWAEIFEPPCIGFAARLEDIAALCAAQADFIALGDLVWNAPAPAQMIARALAQMEPG